MRRAGWKRCSKSRRKVTPVEAALVCHPHPKFGGTMHNKVVYRLARGLRKTGCVVLRFNFRGVNLSEGEYAHGIGETEDARVALRELAARYPASAAVIVAGFSFGSRVALRLASSETAIERAIAAGFPTRIPKRDFVYQLTIPKYFIQSTMMSSARRTRWQDFTPRCRAEVPHLDRRHRSFFQRPARRVRGEVEQIGRERSRN